MDKISDVLKGYGWVLNGNEVTGKGNDRISRVKQRKGRERSGIVRAWQK